MQTKFFQIALVAGTVFAAGQSFTVENAHALDLGGLTKHSGQIGSLLDKYVPDSVREQIQNKTENTGERRSNMSNSSNNDEKWNVDSLLSNSTLRKFR